MLSEDQIRERIKIYCHMQDASDLRDANELENRILGMAEVLIGENYLGNDEGTEFPIDLNGELLEQCGIKVKQVNPEWIFEND